MGQFSSSSDQYDLLQYSLVAQFIDIFTTIQKASKFLNCESSSEKEYADSSFQVESTDLYYTLDSLNMNAIIWTR